MRHVQSILWTLLTAATFTSSAAAQVLLLGSPGGGQPWADDIKAKIIASGVAVGPVTIIDVSTTTPSLAQLQTFNAVLVYSDGAGYLDANAMGNNLHDYVDGGGGVVIGTFTNASIPLAGSWVGAQYDAIMATGQISGTTEVLGTRFVPGHPLFTISPVNSFDGGSSSYRSTGTLAPNSTRLADYVSGDIFAAERNGLTGRVISLNFYPPSSDARSDFWSATTDGDNLLANALSYVGACGSPAHYCVAKVNSLGCTPAISSSGSASASAGSGFVVRGSNVRNGKTGLLIYSVSGRAATPFQGGTLCLQSPIKRTPSVNSGGTPLPASDCSGIYSTDMNAFAVGALGWHPHPALAIMGTTVDCQWWGPDPGFPTPNNTTLTDALEYIVCQ